MEWCSTGCDWPPCWKWRSTVSPWKWWRDTDSAGTRPVLVDALRPRFGQWVSSRGQQWAKPIWAWMLRWTLRPRRIPNCTGSSPPSSRTADGIRFWTTPLIELFRGWRSNGPESICQFATPETHWKPSWNTIEIPLETKTVRHTVGLHGGVAPEGSKHGK